jgi:hypothetical protein
MNGRLAWLEVDLAKTRVYCTVSDYGIIGSSKESKGKGTETATATTTGSVFSVLETEGTAGLASYFATSGLASILVTFARRSSLSSGVRISGRGSVVVITSSSVISAVVSARLAIFGHCGLKNFKNKRGCDNLTKRKKKNCDCY